MSFSCFLFFITNIEQLCIADSFNAASITEAWEEVNLRQGPGFKYSSAFSQYQKGQVCCGETQTEYK